ncbi:MAG: CaiB/BaiF CoA transferase family protein [Dehalococcoidia bacterium]
MGVRVIDMTEVWAGPMATSYLADWGAEVIRVESFPRWETLRPVVPAPGGLGFSHNDPMRPRTWERHARRFIANHSKRGMALNLRDSRGRESLLGLLSIADVVIENYASETMSRLGLGYDTIRAVNPAIVMVSVSGWGGGGPYAGYTAMGSGVDATTGHAVLRGYAGEDPTNTNQGYQSDAMAPLAAVTAVAAALHERRRSGCGRHIEISEAEVLLTALSRHLLDAALNDRPGEQIENEHPWAAPQGCYPCKGEDRWITITIETDIQWASLCNVVGPVNLAESQTFHTCRGRWEHREVLNVYLSTWTKEWDAHELMETLQAHGVPAAVVSDEWDVMNDPHLRAREFWVEKDHPYVERRIYPRTPWRLHECIPAPYRPANTLGEDNHWVLQTLLGMSNADVRRLELDGVIGTTYG